MGAGVIRGWDQVDDEQIEAWGMRDELTGCISVSLRCSLINDILVGTVPRAVIEVIKFDHERMD